MSVSASEINAPTRHYGRRKDRLDRQDGTHSNHQTIERLDAIIKRNAHMVDFAEADVKGLGSRRVLIIVGSGHKFALEDILRARGYEIIPSAGFVP